MDIGLFSIGVGRTADPDIIAQIARQAETVGFDSIWAPEHVVLFDDAAYASQYPYNDTGRIGITDAALLDPFTALTFAAAHTERLKLGTGIFLVPQRHPLVVAKMVASLDRLSKGRFLFGVGIGWLKEEFRALGISPERRAQRTCEYLDAMRTVWTQANPAFDGEFCSFPAVKSLPKPVQQPHPPVIFGGNSAPALRRAVYHGDGWFGFNLSPQEAASSIQQLHVHAREAGRSTEDLFIAVSPGEKMPQMTLDGLKQYCDAGVKQVILRLPTASPDRIDAALEEMAETLIVPAQSLS
jgi:probable F420-dependent oxidoreductase